MKDWKIEFDEKFDIYLFTQEDGREIMIDVPSFMIKDFISQVYKEAYERGKEDINKLITL